MDSTMNWTAYHAARELLKKQVGEYVLAHPEETYPEIGRRFGISSGLVAYYAKLVGVVRPRGGNKTNPQSGTPEER